MSPKKKDWSQLDSLRIAAIVGYIEMAIHFCSTLRRHTMKVSDILRVKGNTLFTVKPDETLSEAMSFMAEKDIGSLVVMAKGALAGMLTFREVIQRIVKNGGQVGSATVDEAMDKQPMTCSSETDLDDVRRMMLDRHARYMPVMDEHMLMGVISFYDVAKAVVDGQNFENKMLKAYIRDWPDEANAESGVKI
jgi:CBS domain-containing protein